MKISKFQKRCELVAERLGLEVVFYDDDSGVDQFEDDGFLHVQNKSIRACFNVSNSQSDSCRAQNVKTRAVMAALGLKVSSRVLGDETDGEDVDFD